jgi:hypothetical protein
MENFAISPKKSVELTLEEKNNSKTFPFFWVGRMKKVILIF